ATLDHRHPRLMLKDAELEALKERYAKDTALQKCVKDVLEQADVYCRLTPMPYNKIGPRLLHVSREYLDRIYALALAWRWTGRAVYADKAVENLLSACDFNDWNPSHFLDTAEMSHAVAIGYDWLFDYLDAPTRERIKSGLLEKGIKPGISVYSGRPFGGFGKWPQVEHNWNQVCNGGMLIAALAVADTEPTYSEFVVRNAVESLPKALGSYAPDGAWMEGPGYWHYATRYTAYALSALKTALGTDFGLSKTEGLSQTAYFPIFTAGPTGLFLNFADSRENSSRRPMACMFWLASTYANQYFGNNEHHILAAGKAQPEHIVWYVPQKGKDFLPPQLDHWFSGPVDVAVFRSAWDDPDALFVGVKGGFNQVNHSHLDLGSFELDALGVRWARDLGSDDYNLAGYWDAGQRWSYYRLRSVSHNVPLLAGQDQNRLAKAKIVKYEPKKSSVFAIVDLTEAYKDFADSVLRGVALVANRRAALVQDEFRITNACQLVWGMTTDAEIALVDEKTARLTIGDKQLVVKVLAPSGAYFQIESAQQPPPENPNTGVRRLTARLDDAQGDVRIAVLLCPQWTDGNIVKTVEVKPLAEW
ncbi:MAG TPA: heparinase II/III family protein, partial [Sedimentisphaerales bacterium]|nr:heparinase II/III family protein [Sedimentisphaerales bacterium]